MENRHPELNRLGWSDWFEERIECGPGETIARVAAVDRELLLLMDQASAFRARLAGSYLYRQRLSQQLPCVGDWVCVERHPGSDIGQIHAILTRRTALRRKTAGDAVEYQMIAANVDYVIIVQSSHSDFNLKRLERYLVMVTEGGAEPYILLTKTDLAEPAVVASQLAEIRAAGIAAPASTLSNVTREGLDDLKQRLLPEKTYCFVGSSGVGKSTLINHLVGRETQETKGVSGTGEGRHATVRRELILLEVGALVIDNPGMRELGILAAESGVEESFGDIVSIASGCRYRNCAHTSEPGCAVREAVEAGAGGRARYES
jgi:ribosome biogenesis GTPase / thiamine phosphate phosphatase